MLETTLELVSAGSGSSIKTATVVGAMDDSGHVRVRREDGAPEPELRAAVALAGSRLPAPGDRALIATLDSGEAFVIGLVAEPAAPTPPPGDVRLSDGSFVRISEEPNPTSVAVLSSERRPLLEYDALKGRITLNAPSGDLELVSPEGDIVLNASRSVRLSGQVIEATARSHVRIGIESESRSALSHVTLDPSATRIAGPVLAVAARRAKLDFDEATFTAERLSARIGSITAVIRRLERVADEVHEQADRMYTAVREFLEVRAGRMRTLVDSTYRLKAKRAHLKSDEDFKVKGDQIHLG